MKEPTATSSIAVRAAGLSKTYGSKQILSDINFEIRPGERCCFVGVNGSGKSTLLEMIMGLKVPSGGQLEVLGCSPLSPRLKEQRVMLMDRASFPYYAKVGEVVWLYSGFHDKPHDGPALLRTFELDAGAYIRHLSKGQKQRLGIMLALLGNPRLIMLDEPTSGLDPQARMKLWESLGAKLREDPQLTLLFATHDLTEAERWADRIGILHGGRLVAMRSPEEHCRSVAGARRKLTVTAGSEVDPAQYRFAEVEAVARVGGEIALYTDQPERVLRKLGINGGAVQIRIESVSVKDAFFKLTGEVPDGTNNLAVQKFR